MLNIFTENKIPILFYSVKIRHMYLTIILQSVTFLQMLIDQAWSQLMIIFFFLEIVWGKAIDFTQKWAQLL